MTVLRSSLLILALAVLVGCQPSESQPAPGTDLDLSPERIVQNLKLQIPQLRQAQNVELGALSSSPVPGFQRSTLTVNGSNRVPVLVREDGEQLLVLAGEPVDISKSADAAEAAMAEEGAARQEALGDVVSRLPARGPDDAKVTLTVFSDFQCPYCAKSLPLIESVREQYPESVRYVFAHFPLPMHKWARPASIAAQCAARQDEDAFWTLHDAFFDNQAGLTPDNVIDRAASYLEGSSIDMEEWRTCATDEGSDAHRSAASLVDTAMQTGEQVQVRGTPTFFVNGEMYRGARNPSALASRIEAALEE
jgi:protein-disulfide isomerase